MYFVPPDALLSDFAVPVSSLSGAADVSASYVTADVPPSDAAAEEALTVLAAPFGSVAAVDGTAADIINIMDSSIAADFFIM
jgi:hypothetical protein